MNIKRWLALVGAVVLFAISIGMNSLVSIASTDWDAIFDPNELLGSSLAANEVMLEEGNMEERIAVVKVNGTIQDVGSGSLFTEIEYDHQFVLNQLAAIQEDETVKGVLLQVDTPGGGVYESRQLYDAIIELKEARDMPIYVSMGSMAASGGYYIAAPADKIYAYSETWTGSIGVIMQGINYGQLAEDYGIVFETLKSGPYKDIMSSTRPMSNEERAIMQTLVDEAYDEFVNVIAAGRGMTDAEVRQIGDGRIYTAKQAVENGLVDAIGDEEAALQALRKDFDLEKAEVFEYGYADATWSVLMSAKAAEFFGPSAEERVLNKLLSDYEAPRAMYLYGE
ncbi:signal peptide peptidase SppA [Caryophanon latum]|uniref:Signal peptide peptidase SppA n=1 Tax=Caryophanon latum TaxID=33977 RepID=A0A1C0Z0N2_9BACL|nr:signal peptide peptidase SppA [Caryophanon latum]OCS93014.1 signal peptide peptidase SppA [Caryophanon latum]